MRNEWHEKWWEDIFGLLEVNLVKLVFGDHTKDGLDKRRTVLRGDRLRHIPGTSPSADGDACHRVVLVSLLDESWN